MTDLELIGPTVAAEPVWARLMVFLRDLVAQGSDPEIIGPRTVELVGTGR